MSMIYTGSTIAFQLQGKFVQAHSTHPEFKRIVELAKAGDFASAAKLVDLKTVVSNALSGSKAELKGDAVYYGGERINSVLAQRILQLAKEGFTVDPLLRFLDNLMENPSKRAVDELYGFLEASKLPITEDGHFLAYKSVRQDFTDHHTGTMDNSVGTVVRMDRNKVDENKDRTCSTGLHFAAHEYARNFGAGGRMVVLKINPRDVVAIPSDYNNQKGRACEYLVLEEVKRDDTKLVGAGIVPTKPVKPVYVPEVDNFDDETRWEETFNVHTFIGTAQQFPVNRDKPYTLQRKSNNKVYRGDFFFTSYNTNTGSLVFQRLKHDGTVDRYVTVTDVKDWYIEFDTDHV